MTEDEIVAFINNPAKRIDGDIAWAPAPNRAAAGMYNFTRPIAVPTAAGDFPDIYLAAWFHPAARLSFAYVIRDRRGASGRIYGLCLGRSHGGLGLTHKHGIRNMRLADYVPSDITAPSGAPAAVWRQFCAESGLIHNGRLLAAPEEL